MDRHQAAYWLDRSPGEAAEFLAKTAVASRRVGGFVKRADGPDWRTMLNHVGSNPALKNSLIGAGVGGLGGLGVGLLNRRKKNPMSAALTGAALGGLGGLAYTGASNYLNDQGSGAADPAGKALAVQEAASVRNADPVTNAIGKVTRSTARANGVGPTPGDDPGAELDGITPGQIARQGLRDAPGVGRAFTNPVQTAAVAGATGVADLGVRSGINQLGEYRNAHKALQEGWDKAGPPKDVRMPPGPPGGPAPTPPVDPTFDLKAMAAKARADVATPSGLGRLVPQPAREMLSGRRLLGQANSGATAGNVAGADLATALREGRKALPAPKPPGRMRGLLGGAIPSLAAQFGSQYLFGRHDADQGDQRYTDGGLGGLFGGRPSQP